MGCVILQSHAGQGRFADMTTPDLSGNPSGAAAPPQLEARLRKLEDQQEQPWIKTLKTTAIVVGCVGGAISIWATLHDQWAQAHPTSEIEVRTGGPLSIQLDSAGNGAVLTYGVVVQNTGHAQGTIQDRSIELVHVGEPGADGPTIKPEVQFLNGPVESDPPFGISSAGNKDLTVKLQLSPEVLQSFVDGIGLQRIKLILTSDTGDHPSAYCFYFGASMADELKRTGKVFTAEQDKICPS